MGPVEAPRDELAALLEGRAFVRLQLRVTRVSGGDASGWLHDLVTADIASLTPGRARRSLLLTPTGRVRADVTVVRDQDGFLLLQDPVQPARLEALLDPYVLSSDVSLADVTPDVIVLSCPPIVPQGEGTRFEPTAAGPGVGVVAPRRSADVVTARLTGSGVLEAGLESLEAWRILGGVPRMGRDFDDGSLPAEAGLGSAIDRTKGCFLGQESVARVADLGHPPRILRRVRSDEPIRPTDPVTVGQREVGHITSAARDLDGSIVAFVRVGWDARDDDLAGPDGGRLTSLPLPD